MKKKNGFTLVELLAVIVILAIILVIAVPQILSTINNATKGSMESSAKMVASAAETQYMTAQATGATFETSGNCLTATWSGLNSTDYSACTYTITNGVASVTLTGAAKFAGYTCTNATKTSATCTNS